MMLAFLLYFGLTLSSPESRAVELYATWQKERLELNRYVDENGQLLLNIPADQVHDFASVPGGLFPTTQAGFELFDDAFQEADRAARSADELGQQMLMRISAESNPVRACFYSLMPVHGLTQPRLAGRRLFFLQKSRDSSCGVFEQDTLPLDGQHPQEQLYCWDLQHGDVTGQGPCSDSYSLSADGSVVALARAGEVWVNDTPLLGTATYRVGRCEVPLEGRAVQSPALADDGQKMVFVCGTYVDRSLEDSGLQTQYFLILYSRRTGQSRVLAGPCGSLKWPQICGDGSQVMVVRDNNTVMKIASDGTSTRELKLTLSSSAQGCPVQMSRDGELALLHGQQGFYQWDTQLRPLAAEEAALSADGRWLALVRGGQLVRQNWQGDRCSPLSLWQGQPFPGPCREPVLSENGQTVAFLCHCCQVPGTVSTALSATPTYPAWRLVVIQGDSVRTLGGHF